MLTHLIGKKIKRDIQERDQNGVSKFQKKYQLLCKYFLKVLEILSFFGFYAIQQFNSVQSTAFSWIEKHSEIVLWIDLAFGAMGKLIQDYVGSYGNSQKDQKDEKEQVFKKDQKDQEDQKDQKEQASQKDQKDENNKKNQKNKKNKQIKKVTNAQISQHAFNLASRVVLQIAYISILIDSLNRNQTGAIIMTTILGTSNIIIILIKSNHYRRRWKAIKAKNEVQALIEVKN